MQRLVTALSTYQVPCKTRDELAQRALGATVVFFTDAAPRKTRRGQVIFADIDTLHLLVEDAEGQDLVPLKNCRVLSLRQKPLNFSYQRLNVWQYGDGWRGYGVAEYARPGTHALGPLTPDLAA